MVIFGIILVAVVVFVVFKVLISEAKPYKKPLNTETAVEESEIPKDKKMVAAKREDSESAIMNADWTCNLYNLAQGYGTAGTKQNEEFDEAEYRAYREELAAYDDFVASLDMDD